MSDQPSSASTVTTPSPLPGYFSLFASLGTLLCCALPSLLVLLGLGATVASALSALPWLVALSRHKVWVFGFSGVLLTANAYYLYRLAPALASRRPACAPGEEAKCAAARRVSRSLLLVSAGIYLAGLFTAYAVGPILGALAQ